MSPDRRLLLGVPLVIGLHDLEELWWLGGGRLEALLQAAPGSIRPWLAGTSEAEMAVAVGLVTLLPVLVLPWALRGAAWAAWLLAGMQAAMALNVGAHLVSAVRIGGYVPGLVTAVLLVLPFSVLLLRQGVAGGWFGRWASAALVPLALVLHGPVLLGLLAIGRLVAP